MSRQNSSTGVPPPPLVLPMFVVVATCVVVLATCSCYVDIVVSAASAAVADDGEEGVVSNNRTHHTICACERETEGRKKAQSVEERGGFAEGAERGNNLRRRDPVVSLRYLRWQRGDGVYSLCVRRCLQKKSSSRLVHSSTMWPLWQFHSDNRGDSRQTVETIHGSW